MATTDLAVSNSKVDLADAPSRDWGWHTGYPGTGRIAGFVVAVILVIMGFVGNHRGHVESIYCCGFAAVILLILGFKWWTGRGKWKN